MEIRKSQDDEKYSIVAAHLYSPVGHSMLKGNPQGHDGGNQARHVAHDRRILPTAKNGMVAQHYGKLGFRQAGSADKGRTVWELKVSDHAFSKLPMRVEDKTAPLLLAAK